jgi:hypothetical protein
MRSLFLLVALVAAGCSSKSADDFAASAKSAASAASKAAAATASTAAGTAKKAVDTAKKAPASAAAAVSMAAKSGAASAGSMAAAAPMVGTPVTGEGTKIVGVWKIDLKSLENDPRLAKMEGPAKEAAMKQAKQMMGKMTTEFTKGGQLIMSLNPQMKMEGTFIVKSVNGNAMVVETTMKQGQKMKTETVNVTVDATSLKLKGPNGQEIAFTK